MFARPYDHAAAALPAAGAATDRPAPRTAPAWTLAVLLVLVASVPLFVGLDRQDIRNDEAIYTYAAQRMAEHGDWLTPRYVDMIEFDGLFLEKPPLKFWIVAGAIRLGLIAGDEFSIRLVDAVMAAIAFAYVMAFGWRIAGVACGAIALLLLLSFQPLLFAHGLRENEMEGALLLSYAAGLYHFAAWASGPTQAHRRLHAHAAALFFVLGFMTKFVAAAFMPVVAVVALLANRGGWTYLTNHWKDWVAPAALTLALTAPWFVYQTVTQGAEFWAIILGGQVVQRFTTFVDPSHVQPWHFYLTDTWRHFQATGGHTAIIAGLVFVTWRAWRKDPAARLLLVWWAVPYLLISLGSSKVIHYAYPFLPPLALAASWMSVEAWRAIDRTAARPVRAILQSLPERLRLASRPTRTVAVALVAIAVALAAATAVTGDSVAITIDDARIFRNSSITRPLVVAVVLLLLSGYGRAAVRVAAAGFMALFLPTQAWANAIERASTTDRPIAAARECLLDLQAATPDLRRGVYVSDQRIPELAVHPLFYNFRHAGPWVVGMDHYTTEVPARLSKPEAHAPLLLSRDQWRAERDGRWPTGPAADASPGPPEALLVSPGVVLVLPGPFGRCAESTRAAGGRPVDEAAGE